MQEARDEQLQPAMSAIAVMVESQVAAQRPGPDSVQETQVPALVLHPRQVAMSPRPTAEATQRPHQPLDEGV